MPAGNSAGGRWTDEDGGGDNGINDPRILSDADSDDALIQGEQYAQNTPLGGHHYVPRGVFGDLPLSPETRRVLEQEVTGPLSGGPHRWSREHDEYNKAVKENLDIFLGRRKIEPEQLTPEQARDFIAEIKDSNDPRIRSFNMKIFIHEIIFQLLMRGRRRR